VVLAVAASWRSQDRRLSDLEAAIERREARWGDRFDRLEAGLARREAPPRVEPAASKVAKPSEPKPSITMDLPTSLALARIEARLGELGQRLEGARAGGEPDDEWVAQVRRDLDQLGQEVKMAHRASRQEGQELGAAIREILQLLRHLASQPRPIETIPVPVPVPVSPPGRQPGVGQGSGMIPGMDTVPGQGQLPGQANRMFAPGRSNR
jgi:hypothetical protein